MKLVGSTIAKNRRASFDYELGKRFEAGISLQGFEVKSAKLGRMDLSGSYIRIIDGEAYLWNASIESYQPKNREEGYDPTRNRKLLLNKKEIQTLASLVKEKRVTLIPTKAYLKKGYIKLDIAVGKSKKKADKREAIKKRDTVREMDRAKRNK